MLYLILGFKSVVPKAYQCAVELALEYKVSSTVSLPGHDLPWIEM